MSELFPPDDLPESAFEPEPPQPPTAKPWTSENGFIASQEYAGCGSHAAEWGSEADFLMALASPELFEALEGLISIGKRDLTNPKYDGYFDFAREALKKARGGK